MKTWITVLAVFFSQWSWANQLTIVDTNNIKYMISDSQLLDMPQTSISTTLPWLEEEATFQGVTLQTLFEQSNLTLPPSLTFVALNNYEVVIPRSDIETYSPIVAILKNGEPMSIRHKGPFWVIFPIAAKPELNNTEYHSKMIWQLKRIQM
ncbi:hypothetical protein [Vibrio methylphosphonaticus]|uniref:hypothetical protein n=1 Tax=Vibrio methylphosphonaticus TaxID=2946866 RepID=UPI00202A8884|nr:hypothetical protein [Vibrio methylphosphonaticus]MCL9773648.1 hypothetical protein [Vibrio methylphosphonaticus]